MSERFLIRIPAHGKPQRIAFPEKAISEELLAELLHTDVTERMRVPAEPEGYPEEAALCYFIDARGGERELPANFIGTCFYHTGCPIYGDLLLAACPVSGAGLSGFSAETAGLLENWLSTQFRDYLYIPENL